MIELIFPERVQNTWDICEENQFMIGSLSHYFNKELPGYEGLPDWQDESALPPDSVREPTSKEGLGSGIPVDLNDFLKETGEEDYYYSDYDYYEEEDAYDDEENLGDDNNLNDHFFDN